MPTTDPTNDLVRVTRSRFNSGLTDTSTMAEAAAAINRCEARLSRQMKNLSLSPDKFTGSSDVEEWFDIFDIIAAETGRTEDADKLALLVLSLAEEALETYMSLPSADRKVYATVRQELIDTFGLSDADKHEAKMLVYSRKQKLLENLRDYVKAMQALSKSTSLTEKEKVQIIVRNARPVVRRALLPLKLTTVKEILNCPFINEDFDDSPMVNVTAPVPQQPAKQVTFKTTHCEGCQCGAHDNRSRSRDRSSSRDRGRSPKPRQPTTQVPQMTSSHFMPPTHLAPPTHSMPPPHFMQPVQMPPVYQQPPTQMYQPFTASSTTCGKCGYSKCQGGQYCAAMSRKCHKCNQLGHLKSRCPYGKQ